MKIMHICLSGPFNDGWGYQENLLAKYNVKDGHDVVVLAPTLAKKKDDRGIVQLKPGTYFTEDGYKVVRIPFLNLISKKLTWKLKIYNDLYETIKTYSPNFIFIHGVNFLSIHTVRKYLSKNNITAVLDIHATYDNSAKNWISKNILHKVIWRFGVLRLQKFIKKAFVLAEGCYIFATQMYKINVNKVEYLYLGADIDEIDFDNKLEIRARIREKYNIPQGNTLIVSGGKLTKGKRMDLLLETFRGIKQNNISLIVFGELDIDVKPLFENIDDTNVHYIGWVDSEKVYDFFLASDLGVFPGSKSALWEQAIASGLPLVCKKWKGMEYVDLGGNVIFFDNQVELSAILNELLSNPEEILKMHKIALDKGPNEFSFRNIARKSIKLQ